VVDLKEIARDALSMPPPPDETSRELRPMSTAPKSGEVLVKVKERAGIPGKWLVGHFMEGGHSIEDHPPIEGGWYFWNGHMFDRAAEPIGWMPLPDETSGEHHGLDNARQVFFYEQDFYVLSNFSAFCVHWRGKPFFTSEHAYHWARFELPEGRGVLLQDCVQRAASAHEAFKFAQAEKSKQRADWDAIKVDTMREILREKAAQHEYVARKLEATGDRELIENSWRDDFWGWGPNRNGQNMLGKLWMEIRAERRSRVKSATEPRT
jgi:ribA/ribD-fused uncharacterized protein